MMEKFKFIKEYWFIFMFIGTVIVSWTTFANRLDAIEKRVEKLETITSTLETIKIDIAVIKEKLINLADKN